MLAPPWSGCASIASCMAPFRSCPTGWPSGWGRPCLPSMAVFMEEDFTSISKIANFTFFAGVDLRSSKVCELGLLNYKAKHVFYPSEKKKFRCWFDYYWASVFKVEYTDHSGQMQLALAEAPSEALPPDCRPTFDAAWLTKDMFKVNGTYDCWYSLGISKVNIYHDGFFNCLADHPSTTEMLRRYSILSTRMLTSWFSSGIRARLWRLDVVAGVVTGFSTSLITVSLAIVLKQVKSSIHQTCAARRLPLAVYAGRLKRACFLVAYFCFVGWLATQYGKRLGLPEILRGY
ncbi:hypothetical protein RJ639_030392 [Escallonia herrerae]|uniref:Uncharacterized protein n=1 Tax=Escallonia herrerae TaxID=1293975 RepID=A0AA88X8T8_9ASTE|nr:hypothetical protein RJ639_030392 [Escallonia herrerae]